MITVVDYKLNNLRSIENTLRRLGHDVQVTSDPEVVKKAQKLILPGVGAFRDAMENLKNLGLVEPFVTRVRSGVPTLGICLGMHLIFTESEEFGLHRGLDLDSRPRAPHSGQRDRPAHGLEPVEAQEAGSSARRVLSREAFVYFVHSYYVEPEFADVTLATTDHGLDFAAVVHKDNLWATQFHPEKSQKVGERLLDNFGRL